MELSAIVVTVLFFTLGIVVTLLATIIKIHIRNITNKQKEILGTMYSMKAQLHDLYVWHDKDDEEGVKVWYVRKSLEKAIESLADNVNKQTQLLGEFLREIKETRKEVNEIKDAIEK